MSGSGSDCCDNACDDACSVWLTTFCDYVSLSLQYCGVTTEFERARAKQIAISESMPGLAVHPTDTIFRVSMEEEPIEVGIGAIVTYGGDDWHVYRAEFYAAFCVWKLWARSVGACFGLLDKVDVMLSDCDDCDCSDEEQWSIAKKTKGSLVAMSGQSQVVNDANQITPRTRLSLVEWPLSGYPTSKHRVRHKGIVYRILRWTNNGPMAPFDLEVEI